MRISSYNSTKIAIINFILIIMVLYIHNYYIEGEHYSISNLLQKLTGSFGLCKSAIPMFFFISGLLFYNNINNIYDCLLKIKKRFKTLVIPYLLWNLIYLSYFIVIQNTPILSKYINEDIIGNLFNGSIFNFFYQLYIVPVGFHLWFLRDLIAIVFISPLIYIFLKRFNVTGLILIYIISLAGIDGFFSWIFYFSLGGFIGLHKSVEKVSNYINRQLFLISLLIYIINAVLVALSLNPHNSFYTSIINLSGMLVIWKSYDYIYKQNLVNLLYPLSFHTFFIYCFHEPIFNIIKKINLLVLGTHQWSLVLLYIINPIIMCVIIIIISKLSKKYLPQLYSFATGGR